MSSIVVVDLQRRQCCSIVAGFTTWGRLFRESARRLQPAVVFALVIDDQTDRRAALAHQILADRFDVIGPPLGWRCRGCAAAVSAPDRPERPDHDAVARLAEAAADHALYCGRCDD